MVGALRGRVLCVSDAGHVYEIKFDRFALARIGRSEARRVA